MNGLERTFEQAPVIMDSEYTYGEDGIPVLIDHSTNHSSPPSSKSRLLKNAEGRRKDSDPEETGESVCQDDAKAVFTIDGEGYDVILSEKRGKIFWTPMSALGKNLNFVLLNSKPLSILLLGTLDIKNIISLFFQYLHINIIVIIVMENLFQ